MNFLCVLGELCGEVFDFADALPGTFFHAAQYSSSDTLSLPK
jgi:hypothetical protein